MLQDSTVSRQEGSHVSRLKLTQVLLVANGCNTQCKFIHQVFSGELRRVRLVLWILSEEYFIICRCATMVYFMNNLYFYTSIKQVESFTV